jgi:hypothetical protein
VRRRDSCRRWRSGRLGERQVDETFTLRQPIPRDEANHPALAVQPHLRHRALPRSGADHRHRAAADVRVVAHIAAHPERRPLGEQVRARPAQRHQQVCTIVAMVGRRQRVGAPVGAADPGVIVDDQSHLALAVEKLLDALATGQLQIDALLAD